MTEELREPQIEALERRVAHLEAAMDDVLDLLDVAPVDPLEAAQEAFLARIRARWKESTEERR